MGIFGRLFGRKKTEAELGLEKPAPIGGDELGLGKERELGLGVEEPTGGPVPAAPTPPAFGGPPAPEEPRAAVQLAPSASPEMQVIAAKLEVLKSMLDSINQRLANLERIAKE